MLNALYRNGSTIGNKKANDMAKKKNRSLSKALSQLLANYVSGRIPDRRWRWIMEVLDSGMLTRREQLEYVTEVNRAFDPRFTKVR